MEKHRDRLQCRTFVDVMEVRTTETCSGRGNGYSSRVLDLSPGRERYIGISEFTAPVHHWPVMPRKYHSSFKKRLMDRRLHVERKSFNSTYYKIL